MINIVYRLTAPKLFEEAIDEINIDEDVIVRPLYLSICKADQRYYQGTRASEILDSKLPMALIHEGIGEVVYDSTGQFKSHSKVVMIPNTPQENDEFIKANYLKSSKFRGSGFDGFTSDLISFKKDRLVEIPDDFNPEISSFIELISVCYQGIMNFEKTANGRKDLLGVWGDGNMGYIIALLLKYLSPDSKVVVFGKHRENLNLFSFADETYKINEIPDDLIIDHGFECVGSDASQTAINQIIDLINPQGMISLFGVSEYNIPINTRLVLEKGLTISGISRSEREDFEGVIEILKNNPEIFGYLDNLITNKITVKSLDDLKEAFDKDSITHFGKTILKWEK